MYADTCFALVFYTHEKTNKSRREHKRHHRLKKCNVKDFIYIKLCLVVLLQWSITCKAFAVFVHVKATLKHKRNLVTHFSLDPSPVLTWFGSIWPVTSLKMGLDLRMYSFVKACRSECLGLTLALNISFCLCIWNWFELGLDYQRTCPGLRLVFAEFHMMFLVHNIKEQRQPSK